MHSCRFKTANCMVAFFAASSRLQSLNVLHCLVRENPGQLYSHAAVASALDDNTLRIVDTSALNAKLKKLNNQLEHCPLYPPQPGSLAICDCTTLFMLSFSDELDVRRNIIPLFFQVRSPNLTTISSEILCKKEHLNLPWEEADAVFTTDTFANLENVAG
ncbi:hypothetical protein C8R45DRAFT_1219018 [Mycena sanguinolenta]|nr:hypothetical protein C8R45DRAFT_1219018 [Mycena sanguinolenta]